MKYIRNGLVVARTVRSRRRASSVSGPLTTTELAHLVGADSGPRS